MPLIHGERGSSVALDDARGVKSEPNGEQQVLLALLKAAKPRGLCLHFQPRHALVHCSAATNYGWYVSANWDRRHPDYTLGGPWSVEAVQRAVEFGLVGVDPSDGAKFAVLTRTGRAFLKALSGQPPRAPQVPGESSRDLKKPSAPHV